MTQLTAGEHIKMHGGLLLLQQQQQQLLLQLMMMMMMMTQSDTAERTVLCHVLSVIAFVLSDL